MSLFRETNILLPKQENKEKWSVIACDQFTSEKEYWDDVERIVGDEPSTLKLILPEVYLKGDYLPRVSQINATMEEYLNQGIFQEYPDSYIYVERTLLDGSIRTGLVGMIDLEEYDYQMGSNSLIRCSEKTVVSRIPPRKKVRENAPIELPHVLLLCDDDQNYIFGTLEAIKKDLKVVYDFELMKQGGHIKGYLLEGNYVEMINEKIEIYQQYAAVKHKDLSADPVIYAVGDGNHSLATAKACYEEKKQSGKASPLCRYSMVELGNIHEKSLIFEPIHRVVMDTDIDALLKEVKEKITAKDGFAVTVYYGDKKEQIYLDRNKGEIDVAILQSFLDDYLKDHRGEVDYIHDDESLIALAAKENSIGFILQPMAKEQFFRGIVADGVLPRKTFSMGHAREKRYYLEARKIKD